MTTIESGMNRKGATLKPPDKSPFKLASVLIVDDHTLVAEGLTAAVDAEQDLCVVGTASTVADAIRMAGEHRPDVVLIDYRLPDGNGARATRDIKEITPETEVVMVTAKTSQEVMAQAIEAGCTGFLRKTSTVDEVVAAVRAASQGETLYTQELVQGMIDRLRHPGPSRGADLTRRELEVLELLARGSSTEEIVNELVISKHTARNHVRSILTKLGTHSKLEAVAVAIRENIIEVDDLQ